MKKLMKMYKVIAFLIILSMVLPSIPMFNSSTVVSAATKIALNKKKLNLEVGKSYTLKISGTNEKVSWSTSKKSIATVSTKGKVKAIKAGTAIITATVNKKKYTCTVTVKKAAKTYSSVSSTPTPTPTPTKAPTLTPTPTPPSTNNGSVETPLAMKEVILGDYKTIMPANWLSDITNYDDYTYAYLYPTTSNPDTYDTSLQILIEKTNSPVLEYSDFKKFIEDIINLENLKEGLEEEFSTYTIINFTTKDVETKFGTTFSAIYTYKASDEYEEVVVTQEIYAVNTNNYFILYGASNLGYQISGELSNISKNVLNNMELR